MKVMITGITGFVGSAIARVLAKRDVQLFGLIRPSSDLSRLANLNVTCIESDVLLPSSLYGVFDWVDVVIHAAGRKPAFGVPELAYHQLHVDGTNHVLAEIEKLDDPPKVLYISSLDVLGPSLNSPLNETAEFNPTSAYARSKASAESLVQIYAQNGLPVTIVRPGFIYGPHDKHYLRLFQSVQHGRFLTINGGYQMCQPTYIDDAVEGMIRCLQNGRVGEIYHIVGPQTVTFRELGNWIAHVLHVKKPSLNLSRPMATLCATGLEFFASILKRNPTLTRADVAYFSENHQYSGGKSHDQLGFSPSVDLQTGLTKTVQWYQEKGLLPVRALSS